MYKVRTHVGPVPTFLGMPIITPIAEHPDATDFTLAANGALVMMHGEFPLHAYAPGCWHEVWHEMDEEEHHAEDRSGDRPARNG